MVIHIAGQVSSLLDLMQFSSSFVNIIYLNINTLLTAFDGDNTELNDGAVLVFSHHANVASSLIVRQWLVVFTKILD